MTMRRLTVWFRDHQFAVDCALAVAILLVELTGAGTVDNPVVYIAMAVAVTVPLAWRRVMPVVAAWTVLALGQVATIIVWESEQPRTAPPGQLGFVVLLYTLIVYVDRRAGLLFAVGLAADIVVVRLLLGPDVSVTIFFVLLYALAWITAEFVGARRAYIEEVSARLAVAEADRDRRAVEAVSAERTRIARELHDVVAHAVSVMIVQADGASYALESDPSKAEAALATISATGRTALTELRRTVSLLRTDDSSESHPEYGTAALARIVEMMRAAGLQVTIEQTGDLDDVPPAVSLGVHRLVQESLTNVLRHGGERPRAAVAVRREENSVTVSIVNSAGEQHPETARAARFGDSGFGVIGMRERVAVLGGELRTGPMADGRWRVAARLPLDPDSIG